MTPIVSGIERAEHFFVAVENVLEIFAIRVENLYNTDHLRGSDGQGILSYFGHGKKTPLN